MLGKTRLPHDFLDLLKAEMGEGYAGLPKKDQRLLAEMAYGSYTRNRDHQTRDGSSFHCRELDQAFGRGRYDSINTVAGFFIKSRRYSKDEGQTKVFYQTKELTQALAAYRLLATEQSRLKKLTKILEGGRVVQTLPNAVNSKDANGVTVPQEVRADTNSIVPVDADGMRLFLHYLNRTLEDTHPVRAIRKYADRQAYQMLADRLTTLIDECRTDVAGYGFIAHQYDVCPSGRMYALGPNLQQAPSVLKEIALAGCWEYDIANAHFSIIHQMAGQFGYRCKVIEYYLANKEQVRMELALGAGLTMKEIKTALIMVVYGARASTSARSAIVQKLGKAKASSLYEMTMFTQIKNEVSKARSFILKNHPKNRKGNLVNLAGKSISTKKEEASPAQQLAHLCQGVEVKALLTAKRILKTRMLLLQHDGWATEKRISKAELDQIKQAIKEETGYEFVIEEKQIRMDKLVSDIIQDEKKRLH